MPNVTKLLHELKEQGIKTLPLKHSNGKIEHPPYSSKFDVGFSDAELTSLSSSGYRDGIAVMHGKCNPDIICLDFDEKNAPGKNLYQSWINIIDDMLLQRLVIEKTRSAGYHVYFKCKSLPVTKALANSSTGAEWIACRSAVSNCITYCAPTNGYTFIQGDLFELQEITEREMQELCDAAAQLNEFTGATKTAKDNHLTIALYPVEYSAIFRLFDDKVHGEWIPEQLYAAGWSTDGVVRKKKLQNDTRQYMKLWRPGRDPRTEDYSANYWYTNKRLSVFTTSTNFPGFDTGQSFMHTPSRVAFYMNDQDWIVTAKFIKQECERLGIDLPREIPMAYSMTVRGREVWKVEIRGVVEWAEKQGYRWLRVSNNDDSVITFIRVVDNVIYESDEKEILREFRNEINKNYPADATHRTLISFIPSMYKYMDVLPLFDGTLMRDTKDSSYIYFANGALKITAAGSELIKYSELNGCVFNKHIKNFNYSPTRDTGAFGEFIRMISIDDDHEKFIKSAIGYCLHYFKLRSYAKAVMIIEDVEDQDEARGRSGKGIIAQFVEWIRWTVQQDGRNYKSDSQFKMQRIVPGVQVYYLNDPAPGVIMNQFYNFITDDWLVEAKGKKSYSISFNNSPKILITTNYLPNLESDSDKDRFIVLPIKKVFGSALSVRDAFNGVIFFDEHWDEQNRNGAIQFAIECIQCYLKEGVKTYENETVKRNADNRLVKTLVPESIIESIEQAIEVASSAKNYDDFKAGISVHDLRTNMPDSMTKAFSWEPSKLVIYVNSLYQYCMRAYQMKNITDKVFGRRLRMYLEKKHYKNITETRNNITGRRITIEVPSKYFVDGTGGNFDGTASNDGTNFVPVITNNDDMF